MQPSFKVIERAKLLLENYSLSFWDALIGAAGLEADVGTIYSEDKQDVPGFGVESTVEANRQFDSVEQLAGYIAKTAKDADRIHGELAKTCQIPVMAPLSFRRVRSGKGFLPPKSQNRNRHVRFAFDLGSLKKKPPPQKRRRPQFLSLSP